MGKILVKWSSKPVSSLSENFRDWVTEGLHIRTIGGYPVQHCLRHGKKTSTYLVSVNGWVGKVNYPHDLFCKENSDRVSVTLPEVNAGFHGCETSCLDTFHAWYFRSKHSAVMADDNSVMSRELAQIEENKERVLSIWGITESSWLEYLEMKADYPVSCVKE